MKNAQKVIFALLFFALGVLVIVLRQLGIVGAETTTWLIAGLILAATGTGIYLASRQHKAE